MSELIFELLIEEIPASMQTKAVNAYQEIFTKHLDRSSIKFDDIQILISSRRIAIYINGICSYIPERIQEISGPKIGSHQAAIDGFCKTHGITQDLLVMQNNVRYVYIKNTPKIDVKTILPNLIEQAICEYIWPKSMTWGNYTFEWIRPIHNILCIFDGQVLPLKIAHLQSNNITYGHMFLAENAIEINNWHNYLEKLNDAFVLADQNKRKRIIQEQLDSLASNLDLVLNQDDALLEEVNGLIEYPFIISGKIQDKFLSLPREILITSMKTHQKYFALYNKENESNVENKKLGKYFAFVSNIPKTEFIVSGNEKVLSARLEDALYFYDQDIKSSLESKLSSLSLVGFYDNLGNMIDKTNRIIELCKFLKPNSNDLHLAAKLCKTDLTSHVVGEFPELQGIMGYYYAIYDGHSEEVAVAIRDHYKPQGINDSLSNNLSSSLISLADKIDSIVGLTLINQKPTGSKDPYGFRRHAIGIIRIILSNKLDVNLRSLILYNISLYKDFFQENINIDQITNNIIGFIDNRTKHFLKNEYDNKLTKAIHLDDNILDYQNKLSILDQYLKEDQSVLSTYKRVGNIIKDKKNFQITNIDVNRFESKYEHELFQALREYEHGLDIALNEKNWLLSLNILSKLTSYINLFFDNVFINTDDENIFNNRISLLSKAKQMFMHFANFDDL
ncbi:MAG: glycine--tRNA ligase subunit beta [Rickettsiaceae bacterium]